ncbi:hypothetical protein [Streptomyces sp. WM6378]|uniref:hypothetical protein n=1 Tax=Streptomyces sp. WM6378 TaxID=1415557 RepID=UPI0006AE9CE5|nr:hypothetical protein [Streptomyces sp. WM6378]KOU35872.1 hypothetical protein ADK54_36010 [Streptomyces sp. WM6378]
MGSMKDQFDDKSQELKNKAKQATGAKKDQAQEQARQAQQKGRSETDRAQQEAQDRFDQDYDI